MYLDAREQRLRAHKIVLRWTGGKAVLPRRSCSSQCDVGIVMQVICPHADATAALDASLAHCSITDSAARDVRSHANKHANTCTFPSFCLTVRWRESQEEVCTCYSTVKCLK